MDALSVTLVGEVQGVGLRAAVVTKGTALGLVGSVANERDGSVSIHLEGPKDRLAAFRRWLEETGTAARIDRVEERWGTATGRYGTVSVEYR